MWQRCVGLLVAIGGLAVAPVAIGGATLGWFANGAIAWGKHAISPSAYDPAADNFFKPFSAKLVAWVMKSILVAVPVFLALGFVPSLMAKLAERRARKGRTPPTRS